MPAPPPPNPPPPEGEGGLGRRDFARGAVVSGDMLRGTGRLPFRPYSAAGAAAAASAALARSCAFAFGADFEGVG